MADRTRLAGLLWLIFALVVWNVVFDRVLVLAGRRYVDAAYAAAAESRPYVLAGPWMQDAQRRALWTAGAAAAAVALTGAAGIAVAVRRGVG